MSYVAFLLRLRNSFTTNQQSRYSRSIGCLNIWKASLARTLCNRKRLGWLASIFLWRPEQWCKLVVCCRYMIVALQGFRNFSQGREDVFVGSASLNPPVVGSCFLFRVLQGDMFSQRISPHRLLLLPNAVRVCFWTCRCLTCLQLLKQIDTVPSQPTNPTN